MKYKRGDYFGELALLNNKPRAATVCAVTKCKCSSIDRQSFKVRTIKDASSMCILLAVFVEICGGLFVLLKEKDVFKYERIDTITVDGHSQV